MYINRFIILSVIIIFFLSTCKKNDNRTPLAQVYDNYLYLEDIQEIIPDNADAEDSLGIIKNKIDLWVKKQTMLRRAELNLTDEQKDIEDIVQDYRASLLIEKYKQEFLKQEIDTTVKEAEIQKYYKAYPESFLLNDIYVKALFFKFSINERHIREFRTAFETDNQDDMIKIAKKYDIKFDDFNNKWIELSIVSNLLPTNIHNPEKVISTIKNIQTRDNEFLYFVLFKDYRLKGETMPFELARDRIKIIILNKQKTHILNKLEKDIYQSDVKSGNIKIFIEN
jgi:hypothetical protein